MKNTIAVLAALVAFSVGLNVKAQLRVGGAPLEKSWGPVKSSYQDARTGETFLVFEAAKESPECAAGRLCQRMRGCDGGAGVIYHGLKCMSAATRLG